MQDGPKNYLRDPFDPQNWVGNGLANTLNDIIKPLVDLDEVAKAAWDLGNHCLPASDRLWTAGTLASNLPLPFFKAGKIGSGAFKGKSGVYDLSTTGGRYIGQSKNMWTRITQHFRPSGNLGKRGFEKTGETFYPMPGSSPLQREVYEQYMINNAGIKNLINIRNPMGGRMDQYFDMIDDVIRQFNLPR